MQIHDYVTTSGKNLIKEYLNELPENEKYIGYRIRELIIEKGLSALIELNTRHLRGKLYEIKFYQNRILYILADQENIYFLHACRKQKNKTEKFEIQTAQGRAKEAGLKI